MSNRISEYLQSLPTVTLVLFVINVTVHVGIFLSSASIGKFAISVSMVNTSSSPYSFKRNQGMILILLKVIGHGEYYRMFTSVFVHSGVKFVFNDCYFQDQIITYTFPIFSQILHIFMNMSTLLTMGVILENTFGSMNLLFITLWSVPLTSALYLLLNW